MVMIMEYLPGGSLYTILNRLGAMSEAAAKYWFAQVVEALLHMECKVRVHGCQVGTA
jgi:serine/threonine protein kinase